MRKERIKLIIIIVLIIVIIMLLLNSCKRVDNESPKPTGNVDIFNINIEGNCKKDNSCDNNQGKNPVTVIDNKPSNNNQTNDNNVPTNPEYPPWDEDEHGYDLNQIFVDDKNGNYIYQNTLHIFTNPAFEFKNVIAPGSSNTYVFEVHNNSQINIKYDIETIEVNRYNINLKYRLKINNNYVVGNDDSWVSANKLRDIGRRLSSNSSHKYSLEWKWDYESGNDRNDTYIGENINEEYKLNIRFRFEEDNV